jgi:hypothetical protein
MASIKDWSHLEPYEKANRHLLPMKKDEHGRIPGLYFWGSMHDEWQMYEMSYEYKIDLFLCKVPEMALLLIASGFAELDTFVPETKESMLLMKRIY